MENNVIPCIPAINSSPESLMLSVGTAKGIYDFLGRTAQISRQAKVAGE